MMRTEIERTRHRILLFYLHRNPFTEPPRPDTFYRIFFNVLTFVACNLQKVKNAVRVIKSPDTRKILLFGEDINFIEMFRLFCLLLREIDIGTSTVRSIVTKEYLLNNRVIIRNRNQQSTFTKYSKRNIHNRYYFSLKFRDDKNI